MLFFVTVTARTHQSRQARVGMSQMGLGRVKTPYPGKSVRRQDTGSVSGRDRGHQRLGSDDVHNPHQIVGEN